MVILGALTCGRAPDCLALSCLVKGILNVETTPRAYIELHCDIREGSALATEERLLPETTENG
jgi:hypothetical protein